MKKDQPVWLVEALIKNRLILFNDLKYAEKREDEKEQKMIRTEIQSINDKISSYDKMTKMTNQDKKSGVNT